MLLSWFVASAIALSAPAPATADAGVDPWVNEQLQTGGQVEFIVRLKAKAQLDDVRQVGNALQRRTMLIDRLRSTAAGSQAVLIESLARAGVEHRSFWITNAVWVRGDRELLEEIRKRADVAWIHANPSVKMARN